MRTKPPDSKYRKFIINWWVGWLKLYAATDNDREFLEVVQRTLKENGTLSEPELKLLIWISAPLYSETK